MSDVHRLVAARIKARLWDDRACHVALSLPEDNGKHVWATLRGKLAAALAERPKRSKHPPTLLATAATNVALVAVLVKSTPQTIMHSNPGQGRYFCSADGTVS